MHNPSAAGRQRSRVGEARLFHHPSGSTAATDAIARTRLAISVDGHRLAALRLAPPSAVAAPPLVMLHEGLGSIAQWTWRDIDVPARLAARLRRPVLAYDRLGFGGSDRLPERRRPDYLYREADRVLPAVLDQCGIGRCHLLGHSDGATIALLFAATTPDRAVSVVSEAAHVFIERLSIDGVRSARDAFHRPGSRLRAALARHHGDNVDWMFENWADVWLDPAHQAFDMTALLPRIASPVLAIQGAQDAYGTPAQFAAIARLVGGPVETWLIPECGHAPHFEAAERILARVAAFVERAETATAR